MDLIEFFREKYEEQGNIIIVIKQFNDLNTACPTQFEFTDVDVYDYYFRLRHGYATLENTTLRTTIISDIMEGCDGVCNYNEMVEWAEEHKITIIKQKGQTI